MSGLEKELSGVSEWKDQARLVEASRKMSSLKQEVEQFEQFQKEAEDLAELIDLSSKDKDFKLAQETAKMAAKLFQKLEAKESEVFLSGPYDKNNAILTINAGAGGNDAEDWATILLRMYERFADRRGFKYSTFSRSFGQPGPEGRMGTKEVALEIRGKNAFGLLRGESGVHRLVRISPFSAKQLRHTSFASIEVMPELAEEIAREIEIKEEDLRVDTYRASGPGGQYVNKRESAIRITHLPTKIVVSCQVERTQGMNRKKAMDILRSKLLQKKEREKKSKMERVKGVSKSPEWGNQIRSYVFYPYKMVKDHRTGVETSQLETALDGNLDQFIEAELRLT
ncbi:MAG: peptide chain release factor 2 [Parcubacteria group bacterium CG08_land_8_20_14_0_20_43_9]|nr:MAG: peptide chain release factor 2 [Parcubacteria group bacterium CG08_land_8_20_14_0_20_43_9]